MGFFRRPMDAFRELLQFTADKATHDIVEGVHVAGLTAGDGKGRYVLFQRSPENDPDDGGYTWSSTIRRIRLTESSVNAGSGGERSKSI